MIRRTRRLRHIVLAALLGVAGLGVLLGASPAEAADATSESGFVSRINSERGAAGVGSLSVASDLTSVARRHAERMAAAGDPYHNPNLAAEGGDWQVIAENVGVGYDVPGLHQAFMGSAGHRANILDGRMTEVGVGVVRTSDSRLWVVQVFRRPMASAPAPAPAPAPAAPAPTTPPTTAAPAPTTTAAPTTTVPAPTTSTTAAPAPEVSVASPVRAAADSGGAVIVPISHVTTPASAATPTGAALVAAGSLALVVWALRTAVRTGRVSAPAWR